MNPSLLAVDIVVSGAPGVCAVSPKSAATRNVKQSLTAPSDSPFLSGSSQPTQFDSALREKVVSRISQEGQDKPKLQTNDSNNLADNALGSPQLVTPETSLVDSVDVGEGGAAEIDALSVPEEESEYQNNPAPLINVPPDSGLSLVSLPVSGLNVTKPLGPVPLAVESEDESFPTSLNQPVTSDVTANISPSQLVTDTEQMIGKNLDTTNLFNKTPIGKTHLTIGENPPPFLSLTEDTGAERLDAPATVFRQEAAGGLRTPTNPVGCLCRSAGGMHGRSACTRRVCCF